MFVSSIYEGTPNSTPEAGEKGLLFYSVRKFPITRVYQPHFGVNQLTGGESARLGLQWSQAVNLCF